MVQFLSSSIENERARLQYHKLDDYEQGKAQGLIQGVELFINLPSELARYKLIEAEEKKRLEHLNKLGAEPRQY